MNAFLKFILPYIAHLWILIVIATIASYIYIIFQKKNGNLIRKRLRIESIPNIISTCGVLGTFLGISLGLLCFNTKDLNNSIPQLLEGLKTAFFTSLAGMAGSLLLSRLIYRLYDEETGGVSDINQAASLICNAVSDLKSASTQQANSQTVFYNLMQALIQQMDANVANMTVNLNSLNTAASNIALNTTQIAQNTKDSLDKNVSISNRLDELYAVHSSLVTSVGNIEEFIHSFPGQLKAQADISSRIENRLGDIIDHTEAIVSTDGEISEKISTLTTKLHDEVVEIEDKMSEVNTLLVTKFNEFSELMRRNNTEALVEVMKAVTIEFQTQMNSLINKLVQENFDQLNKSVERLNTWQMENKEMISSLTQQYRQMADNFANTSTSLTKVKDDTQSLVGAGGKLEKLVNSLNEVIVKDEKFKEISTNLQKTADLSKSNMESFDASTRKLNEWVRNQRNFNDSVSLLIQKLEELNEMRNYSSRFWEETKSGMNDAVGIIHAGSRTLNEQITNIDQQFYARLSTTLSQLDACIQAIISNAHNRR